MCAPATPLTGITVLYVIYRLVLEPLQHLPPLLS